MATPRVLILRAPGTNCDLETAFAFQSVGAETVSLHINRLFENSDFLNQAEVFCLPGGFSYGDDIAAGRILANQIRHHLQDLLHAFKDAGKLVLGICNGFQILVKSGLLLTDSVDGEAPATLTWNESGRFQDRWVQLETVGDRCVFLKGISSMYLPIAHAEGKFIARDPETLSRLEQHGQLVLKYACNPNGSQADVAGVCDESGRVFGLMPHPERNIDPTHHPQWTRRPLAEEGDGLQVFRNAVEFFA